MAKAIGRLTLTGIAKQPIFGTAAASPDYQIIVTDNPTFTPVQNKVENIGNMGSSYATNAIVNTIRSATAGMEIKIDENSFPLIMGTRFDITTTTGSEANAYIHTLTYGNDTNYWLTLFFQDDASQDYVVRDVLPGNLEITSDTDFYRLSPDFAGAYPVTASVTVTVEAAREFVGAAHETLALNTTGSSPAAVSVLDVMQRFNFGRSAETDNFALGNRDLASHVHTVDSFEIEATKLREDETYFNYFTNDSRLIAEYSVINTDRLITGTTGTNPSIVYTYPVAAETGYTIDRVLDNLVKETITLKAIDEPGVTDAPAKIIVTNSVASY